MEQPSTPTPEQKKPELDLYEVALLIARRAVEAYTRGNLSAASAHSSDLNVLLPHADPFELMRGERPQTV